MSVWVEIVCDECALSGPGHDGRYGTRPAVLREEATRKGWQVRLPRDPGGGNQRDVCPHCVRRIAEATP
ncbi:MAG TPA: hypothetical protein VK966_00950 [Longimicrobiales bacterium]|nr:hypothetical protein [Longimicrobiales bacterium]